MKRTFYQHWRQDQDLRGDPSSPEWRSSGRASDPEQVLELHAGIGGGAMLRLKDPKQTELVVARDRVHELKSRLGI